MRIHYITLALIFFITGCATTSSESVTANIDSAESTMSAPASVSENTSAPSTSEDSNATLSNVTMFSYQNTNVQTTSLLKAGKSTLSEEALKKILSSRVVLPKKGHLAIMRFPGPEQTATSLYGNNYRRSELYLKTDSSYIDSLTTKLKKSDRIIAVTLLPALLSPADAGIPSLREASVRLQADLLLAFRISSDIYNQSNANSVKAFSTFEAVLMDIRTGLIPYTTVVTKDNEQELSPEESDINEVRIRAEREAILSSLSIVADEITEFLRSVP